MSCGGSKKDQSFDPTQIPEICRGMDMNDPGIREMCGVRKTRYQGYKNVPLQRYLIKPKGAALVKKGSKIELRLPNTAPVSLPSNFSDEIMFSEDLRSDYLKNRYIYKEIYPDDGERMRMFKLVIPFESGKLGSVCYDVPNSNSAPKKRTNLGFHLEELDCADFSDLLKQYGK